MITLRGVSNIRCIWQSSLKVGCWVHGPMLWNFCSRATNVRDKLECLCLAGISSL